MIVNFRSRASFPEPRRNNQGHRVARVNLGQGGARILQALDSSVIDLNDLVPGLHTAASGGQSLKHTLNQNLLSARCHVFRPLQPQASSGLALFLRLLAHQKRNSLGQRSEHTHRLNSRRCPGFSPGLWGGTGGSRGS